jgi:hypothetical protein
VLSGTGIERLLPLFFGFFTLIPHFSEQIFLRLILLKLFFQILLGQFVGLALSYLFHQQLILPLYLLLLVLLILVFVTFVLCEGIWLSRDYLRDMFDQRPLLVVRRIELLGHAAY